MTEAIAKTGTPIESGVEIPLDEIKIPGTNPRTRFDPENIANLAASFIDIGQLQNVIVRPCEEEGWNYELAGGERRYHAAHTAFWDTIRADIKDLGDKEFYEVMALENMHREELAPVEEAAGLKQVLDADEDMTQTELAERIGKSQSWVANRLRLLRGPEKMQEWLIAREITPKHAKLMLKYKDYKIFEKVMEEAESLIRKEKKYSAREWETKMKKVVTWWGRPEGDEYDYVYDPWAEPGYSVPDWTEYFDNSECEGCDHIVIYDRDFGDPKKRCLNTECFKPKIEEAKEELEKAKEERKKKLEEEDIVPTNDMDYRQYEVLIESKIGEEQLKECKEKCDDYGTGEDGSTVCTAPQCARSHKKEKEERERKEKEQRDKKMQKAIDEALYEKDSPDPEDYRRVIYTLLGGTDQHHSQATQERVLRQWITNDDGENVMSDEAGIWDLVKEIPVPELPFAMLHVCKIMEAYENRLKSNSYLKKEDLEETFPEALDHYEKPDLEEDE